MAPRKLDAGEGKILCAHARDQQSGKEDSQNNRDGEELDEEALDKLDVDPAEAAAVGGARFSSRIGS